MSRYVKGIISGLGAVAATLEGTYPSWRWLPAVTAGLVAVGVALFPNAPGKPQGKP